MILLDLTVQSALQRFGQQKLRAEAFRLQTHLLSQLFARRFDNARIIHHLRRDRDQSADLLFFDDQRLILGPRHINGSGKTRRPAADDDDIIHPFHDQMMPTRSRLGFKVLAPGCHLAGHT